MNPDKVRHHLNELKNKHHRIQQEINTLIHTRKPDEQIAELKKEKLRLKDEIAIFETKLQSND